MDARQIEQDLNKLCRQARWDQIRRKIRHLCGMNALADSIDCGMGRLAVTIAVCVFFVTAVTFVERHPARELIACFIFAAAAFGLTHLARWTVRGFMGD